MTGEELANAHWGYIKALLKTLRLPKVIIKLIGFFYVTAFIHGYKHGVESVSDKEYQE